VLFSVVLRSEHLAFGDHCHELVSLSVEELGERANCWDFDLVLRDRPAIGNNSVAVGSWQECSASPHGHQPPHVGQYVRMWCPTDVVSDDGRSRFVDVEVEQVLAPFGENVPPLPLSTPLPAEFVVSSRLPMTYVTPNHTQLHAVSSCRRRR
jgi:hypothetical protein